jgi:hypothetical protein
LGHPDDFVRTEIATALKRGIRVIPALVDGASMPRSDELPDALKPLARRQALAVSHEHFRIDAGLLVNAVEQALQAAQNPPGPMPSAHQPSPGPTVPHPTARSESSQVYAEIVGPSKIVVGKRAIYRAEFKGDLKFEWQYTQPVTLIDRNVWVELGYPGQTETLTLKVTGPDGRTATASKMLTAIKPEESSHVYAEIVGPSKVFVGKRAIYRAEFEGDLRFEWHYTQPIRLTDRNVWVELGYPGQTETLTLKVTNPDGRTFTTSKTITAVE